MNVKDIDNLKHYGAFNGEYAIYTTKDNKEGIINRQGEIVFPAEKYELVFHHHDDVFELWLNTDGVIKCSKFYDAKLGKEVPEPEMEKPQRPELPENAKKYEEAHWCASNRIVFKDGELYGFMDENGNVIVPPTYTSGPIPSTTSKKDRFSVKKDGKNGYIDLEGNVVIPFEHPYVGYREKLGIHIFHSKEDKWGIMDKSGKIIIPAIYDSISVGNAYGLDEIAVAKDGRCYFINAKQEEVKVF